MCIRDSSKANLLTYRWPELRAEVHRLLQKADLLVSTDADPRLS
jgi:ribonuclease P protein component